MTRTSVVVDVSYLDGWHLYSSVNGDEIISEGVGRGRLYSPQAGSAAVTASDTAAGTQGSSCIAFFGVCHLPAR